MPSEPALPSILLQGGGLGYFPRCNGMGVLDCDCNGMLFVSRWLSMGKVKSAGSKVIPCAMTILHHSLLLTSPHGQAASVKEMF